MKPRKVPPGTFVIGALVGAGLGLPLLALALVGLARVAGVGDPATSLDHVVKLAALFASLPALLSGGGAARLAAHRAAEHAGDPSPIRPILLATAAMGAAGIGLAVLVAVPLGGMPDEPLRWTPLAGAGFLAGAVTGAAIGVLTAARLRRHQARLREVAR